VLHHTALHRKMREHLPEGRWTRRHWIHASLFATLGVLVATIIPGFSNALDAPVYTTRATLPLALPPMTPSKQEDVGEHWQTVRVEPGHTLGAMFEELGIPATTMQTLLEHPGTKEVLTRLRPGAEIAFDLPAPGQLRAIRFDRDASHRVELSLLDGLIR